MKVIVSESLGLEYTMDVISSCNQNGMQAIADNQNNEILFYDPKNRQYCTNKDLMNADYSIHDVFTDKSVRSQVMKPTSGQGFEEFATKWDALQKSDDQDVFKTKNCSMIRFGAHESGKPRIVGNRKPRKEFMDKVERFRSKWKSLDDKDDYVDDFGDKVNGVEAQVSEGPDDNPNDWSASEGEIEIMWDTDDYEDFGIFRGEGSTYVIDYDRVDTHDQLVNEVCRLIGKEYPDLDFDPDDFIMVNEDEFWEQRGGNPGKWDDDDLYLENEGNNVVDVNLLFTHGHYGKGLKSGDERTIKVDLSEIPEIYDEDDLMSWIADIATKQLPGKGSFTKYDFEIADLDSLIKAVKGDEGFGPDVDIDMDNFGPDSIPDNVSYGDAMKIYRKMRDAYDKYKLQYKDFDVARNKLMDSVVKGLLKEKSLDELADEWFIDYGTANGWGWKTAFKYNVASRLHEIHKKKHPDQHKPVPQREHWRGWSEDNCSCGFCSSSDSSD